MTVSHIFKYNQSVLKINVEFASEVWHDFIAYNDPDPAVTIEFEWNNGVTIFLRDIGTLSKFKNHFTNGFDSEQSNIKITHDHTGVTIYNYVSGIGSDKHFKCLIPKNVANEIITWLDSVKFA